MKLLSTKNIVVFMSLALAGLIALQLHWINEASELKQVQFNDNVNACLSKVAITLNKETYLQHLATEPKDQRKFEHKKTQHPFYDTAQIHAGVKHVQTDIFEIANTPFTEDNFFVNSGNTRSNRMINEFKTPTHRKTVTISTKDCVTQVDISSTRNADTDEYDQRGYTISYNQKCNLRDKLNNQKQLISELQQDAQISDIPLQERLKNLHIDSIIKDELRKYEIAGDFEYAVTNEENRPVLYSKNYNEQADYKVFRAELFPTNFLTDQSFINVYFPKENSLAFAKLGALSFTSLGLIAFIILLFATTVYLLGKQRRLSEMKTAFINNMTHELKTPISTISLASEMLQTDAFKTDENKVVKYAGVIHSENQKLGSQVEKVLQAAAFDKGDFKLSLEKVNVHESIEELVKLYEVKLENSKGVINTNFLANQSTILADKFHVNHILSNIIDNAIKYTKQTPNILIKTANTGSGVMVEIKDNGIGIKKADIKKIFEKFYRVPTGNVHDFKGFGLGLSYVYDMVKAHGGSVTVDSEIGKGSTFKIFLPSSQTLIETT